MNAVTESALQLIDSADAGQTLTLSMFNFTFPGTAEALIRAHHRGVDVHVLLNSEIRRLQQRDLLRKALGRNSKKRSWAVTRAGGLRMHSKFLLLSPTADRPAVVWVSSGNLTMASGVQQANEALTIRGDQPLYDFLAEQFDLMRSGVTDPEQLGRVAQTDTAVVRSFPVTGGVAASDPVLNLLSDVTCVHGEDRTVIRLGQLFLTIERLGVAKRLRQLKESGCDVRVIGHLSVWVDEAEKLLLRPGRGRIDLRDSLDTAIHTKITTIDGWDAAGRPLLRAVIGSHNLTGRALSRTPDGVNDELMMQVWNPATVRSYSAWVDQVIARHSKPAGRG